MRQSYGLPRSGATLLFRISCENEKRKGNIMTDIETIEDKKQRKYLNGLLFSLLLMPCYLSLLLLSSIFMVYVVTFLIEAAPLLAMGTTFLIILASLLIFVSILIIHNTFFALFTRSLWMKYHPTMNRGVINLICWGTFVVPGVLHLIAIVEPAWRKNSARVKWLLGATILGSLFVFGPFLWNIWVTVLGLMFIVKPSQWMFTSTALVNVYFYGSFIILLLIGLSYISIATVKHSLSLKKIYGMMMMIVLCLSSVYGITLWLDWQWNKVSHELATYGVPVNRAEFQSFINHGTEPDGSYERWREVVDQYYEPLIYIEEGLECPRWQLTPELIAKRDAYLERIAPAMEIIDSLLDNNIVFPFEASMPLWEIHRMVNSGPVWLAEIYSMRVQAAMEGENPDTTAALEIFRNSGKLVKQSNYFVIDSLYGGNVETLRLNTLADMIATGKLTKEDYIELDNELKEAEQKLLQAWRRVYLIKPGGKIVGADDTLSGIDGPYPFNLNHILLAPLYTMTIQSKISTAKSYLKLMPYVLDIPSELDYWQLSPQPYPDLQQLEPVRYGDAISLQERYRTISMIRSARVAVRHAAGLETDSIRDPFIDAPFQIYEGKFLTSGENFDNGRWTRTVLENGKWVHRKHKVRGIRVYSEGLKQLEKKYRMALDFSFDIIFEEIE